MPAEKKARIAVVKKIALAGAALLLVAVLLLAALLPRRAVLPALSLPARQEGELRLHFLSVGQADCTLVEFPSGNVLVVDAGDGSASSVNKIVRYLKGLAPNKIEMLLTHADADHYGGFRALFREFGAEKFYLPAVPAETKEYTGLLGEIGAKGCGEPFARYSRIDDPSGAYIVGISPHGQGETDANEASAVLYLSYGGVRAVLCGDISAARERSLVREYSLSEGIFDSGEDAVRLEEVEILKAAHHGSGSASCAEWLSLLLPETIVVSCGAGNEYRHPAGDALSRMTCGEIYRTDRLGDIVVSILGGTYSVTTEEQI